MFQALTYLLRLWNWFTGNFHNIQDIITSPVCGLNGRLLPLLCDVQAVRLPGPFGRTNSVNRGHWQQKGKVKDENKML